ncbi:MAG: hypothetical protein LIO99_13110 [Clostridiales bacterium]|nr:hypothetical protein [Clostridiales bacterium]MCC8106916.1 hypothetical protein [Clostridiales bacterium]
MKAYKVLSLGEILNEEYELSQIKDSFRRFSCERENDLEIFLQQKAISYETSNYGKTYLLVDLERLRNGNFDIAAYFTIAQKSVDISCLSGKRKRKMLGEYPGRDTLQSVPAYLIGQLGRSDVYTKEDIPGETILFECYHAISIAARAIGGNLLILECREHMYKKFYERQNFKKLYDEVSDEGMYTLYKKINFSEYWINTAMFEKATA